MPPCGRHSGTVLPGIRTNRRVRASVTPAVPRYFPPTDASICFCTFSRLNDPGVWLGG